MKKAICIGINNYPGSANDLKGCVNDATDWSALLQEYGFATSLLLDAQATRQNVKTALQNLVTGAGAGDVLVFTYSGHGTQAVDISSDEGDTYDEALYVYDGTVLDDDIRSIINQMNPAATLVVISDSCFSGSVTRLIPENAKPRFMPPPHDLSVGRLVGQRLLLPEGNMPEVLLSGCTDSEYSYDAQIDGRYNGAMTAMALRVIHQQPNQTYAQFYANLRTLLPSSDYPQTPQLEGSEAHKNTLIFQPFEAATVPEPPPTPEPPTPPLDSPGCLTSIFQGIARMFK